MPEAKKLPKKEWSGLFIYTNSIVIETEGLWENILRKQLVKK